MGCGASSSKGGVPSEPAPNDTKGSGTPPTPSKQAQESLPAISEPEPAASGASRCGSQTRPSSGNASFAAAPPVPPPPATPQPPSPAGSQGKLQAPTDVSTRPAMQMPKPAAGFASCLAPAEQQQLTPPGSPPEMPEGMQMHIQHMAGGGGSPAGLCAATTQVRQLLCRTRPPIQALLDAGVAAALVRCLNEGPPDAKLEAAWALTNIAASPVYVHVEALCNAEAPEVLRALLVQLLRPGSGSRGGQAAAASAALQEQLLWVLGNIAGVLHPEMRTQALAVEVLDAGALALVLTIIESEAAAAAARADGSASPLLRRAVWCLHNLAKHKREKDMVNAIPIATRLLLESSDQEVLTCCAWVLAYLGSNEDNKSHLKQALPALPRLASWVREASSSLATPALLCLGTMCTGYMRALDYSGDVVEAGGVPAMLSYLHKASEGGRRDMAKEALFALSNVAGANNATVKALLDAGVFTDVIALMRTAGEDEDVRVECLYVLTNPWDPLVGVEVATVQQLMDCGILTELHNLLDAGAPAIRLGLLLKGLADGLKRGQQLMTYAANLMLVELGREAAAAAPPPVNPVVQLYTSLGTVAKIQALNSHSDEEVATRANGILTMLKFM